MKYEQSEADLAAEAAITPTQLFLDELARFCSLARVPEDAAIAAIQAAYRRNPSTETPMPGAFVDSLGASQVLSTWHENSRFLDSEGRPAALSLENGQFLNLCHSSGIDSSQEEVLELLVRSGAARRNNDEVTVMRRHLILEDNQPAAVARAVRTVHGLLSTVNHNLSRVADEPGRFERSVANRRLSAKQLPALLAHLNVHAESFLEDLDCWMSARESNEARATIGVAVYLYVDPTHGERRDLMAALR